MIQIRLEHAEEIKKLFARTPKEARIILWRALNRSAVAVRTRASVLIRKNYIIKASDIKSKIKIRKATANQLVAEVRASGPVTPLMKFDVSPTMPDIMRVTARVKKGGKKPIQHGFVARMSSGHINVFTRVGTSRYPIKGLYGPSIAQMMGGDLVADNLLDRGQQVLDERLEHELNRLLRGDI